MQFKVTGRAAPTFGRAAIAPIMNKALVISVLALGLAGCEHLEDKPSHSAGWSLLEPSQRHPIIVSQQPHNMSVRVARGASGLAPHQRAELYNFLTKYRAQDGGNSKIVISVPAGSANEVAAMHAVADMRPMLSDHGFSESSITVEPYHSGKDPQPPIRVSYLRYVAEGPECGRWPENLADSKRNVNYENFGCAQQKNLAAMISNPADLLGPRTMTAAPADRRDVTYEKYAKGESSHANRTGDERVTKQ
jgi:pilus assembly protein CpaD